MQNPTNIINSIRSLLNTIRVTLQNITAERNQYQNLLHDSIQQVDNLRNQYTDSENQNLQLQRLLDESQVQVERTVRKETMLKESGTWLCWPIIMRNKNPVTRYFHIGIKIGVFKDYYEKNLLNSYCISEILTVFSKIPDSCRPMPKTR